MPMAGRSTYTPMPIENREEREQDKMNEQQLYFDNAKTVRSQAAMIEGLLKKISKLQKKEIMNETEQIFNGDYRKEKNFESNQRVGDLTDMKELYGIIVKKHE